MTNSRQAIYNDLHGGQLKTEEQANRASAVRVLDIVATYLQPASVLDVGCGIGTWLSVLGDRGVADLAGIEGAWLDRKDVVCDPTLLQVVDLESGFDLGRRFDLVISLEVAEHLSADAAEPFVQSLVRHAPVVLFSAAIPFQGGHHHVNEQFLSYWELLFGKHDFLLIDVIRGQIWHDQTVLWWLRQNIVLFAHKELIANCEPLRAAAFQTKSPHSIVHPDVYLSRMRTLNAQVEQLKRLDAFLREGGSFTTKVNDNGAIELSRLPS